MRRRMRYGGPSFGPEGVEYGGRPMFGGGPEYGGGPSHRGGGSPYRGGSPYGRGGAGRGRRRRGEVRAALLFLLSEEPRNGYQLMQAIEERSGGRWSPSPGSIYPTLAQLEDQGLIRSTEREGQKLFELTDEGRSQLEEHHPHGAPWEHDDEPEAFGDLRRQVKQLHVAAMQVAHAGRTEQIERAAKALAEARRTLYGILAEEDGD